MTSVFMVFISKTKEKHVIDRLSVIDSEMLFQIIYSFCIRIESVGSPGGKA